MIKRILPFVMIIAVLLSVMTVPVSAAETSGAYFNVLDFATANNSGSNIFSVSGTQDVIYNLATTLGSFRCYYVDILYQVTGSSPNVSLYFGEFGLDLSNDHLGNGMYHLYGSVGGYIRSDFRFNITSGGTSYFSIFSFVVSCVPDNRTNIAATVRADSGTSAILSPGGNCMVQSSVTAGSVQDDFYDITITESYWKDYDYIELRSTLHALSVQSVVAFIYTGDYLPLECSYIGDGNSEYSSEFYISCIVDLTNIDHSYSGDLHIRITALNNVYSGLFNVYGLQGIIFSEPLDSQMTWYQVIYKKINSIYNTLTSFSNSLTSKLTSYFKNILSEVSNGFTYVVSKLNSLINGTPVDDGVTDDMQQSENELGNMTDQMDQLSPTVDVGDVNVNIDDFVDADSTVQVSNVLAIITNQPIIVSMLSILAGFALMGYVFFGKR